MQGAGYQLLACTTFPVYQNRHVNIGNLINPGDHLLNSFGTADNLAKMHVPRRRLSSLFAAFQTAQRPLHHLF